MLARAGLFAVKRTAEQQLKKAELASLGTQLALLTGYEYFQNNNHETKSSPTQHQKNYLRK